MGKKSRVINLVLLFYKKTLIISLLYYSLAYNQYTNIK